MHSQKDPKILDNVMIWKHSPRCCPFLRQRTVMMTSSNGSMFVLLAFCAGNSSVTGKQRPVTRSFYVFFDLHPIKRLSKQSRRQWFETPSRSLWRHRNVMWNFYIFLTRQVRHSIKIESFQNANVVVTGGISGCHNDDFLWYKWR